MRKWTGLSVLVFLAVSPLWGQLILEQTGVQVSTAPGSSVVLLGTQRHVSNSVPILSFVAEVLTDEDQDGLVSPELDKDVAWQSLWIAVDPESGDYTVATPEGYSLRQRGFPEDLRPGAKSLSELVQYANLLVVRPGEGAWFARAGGDRDSNGSVSASLDRFEGLGDPPPKKLKNLKPGDTVAMLDHLWLNIAVGIVDPSGGAGQ